MKTCGIWIVLTTLNAAMAGAVYAADVAGKWRSEFTSPIGQLKYIYDDQMNGTIKDYEFYLSHDGRDFGQPLKKGTLGEGKEKKTVTFDAKQARFIKLKALSEINDQAWTSAAEIGVI